MSLIYESAYQEVKKELQLATIEFKNAARRYYALLDAEHALGCLTNRYHVMVDASKSGQTFMKTGVIFAPFKE